MFTWTWTDLLLHKHPPTERKLLSVLISVSSSSLWFDVGGFSLYSDIIVGLFTVYDHFQLLSMELTTLLLSLHTKRFHWDVDRNVSMLLVELHYQCFSLKVGRSGSVCFPETGQMVDGPQYGTSPPPWDIPVSMPQRYTDMVEKVRVPHSSFVKVQRVFIIVDSRAVSNYCVFYVSDMHTCLCVF